jgi:hypothetical protein
MMNFKSRLVAALLLWEDTQYAFNRRLGAARDLLKVLQKIKFLFG